MTKVRNDLALTFSSAFYFAGECLAIVLGKELYPKSGVVLAVVIGRNAPNAHNFLEEIVFSVGSLDNLTAKLHFYEGIAKQNNIFMRECLVKNTFFMRELANMEFCRSMQKQSDEVGCLQNGQPVGISFSCC